MNFANTAIILAAAILCLSGCGKKAGMGSASSENPAGNYPLPDPPVVVNCQPGIRGGRFVITELGEPKTFNYLMANEASSIDICRFMFWNLLNLDLPTQTVKPGLAEFWTNSPDGKTWTFTLRKNLRWSDGAPLTADDVIFTWDVITNSAFPNSMIDPYIIHGKTFTVTKIDDLTIQVVTPEVYAPFLQAFGAGLPIFPKHALEKYAADGTFASAYGVNWDPKNIVCNGPYVLKEYKQAQYTLLERNPYFLEVDKKGARLPYFDELIFTIAPNIDALSLRFLSGESDVNDYVYPYEYETYKAQADKGKFTLHEPGIGLETQYFWFNQNTNNNPKTGKPYVDPIKLSWFQNTKFRQAVSYAINRDDIAKSVYAGRAVPQYGFLTEGYQNWNDTNIQTYPYNPEKALELLKEIGIEKRNGNDFLTDSNGNKIEFVFNTNVENDNRKKITVLIAGDLKKLGMNVILQPIEFNTLITRMEDTFNYDCILMGSYSMSGTDPSGSMNILLSNGDMHEWFPREKEPSTPWEARINYLMGAQLTTLDLAQRQKSFDEVQEILAVQQPMIFTVTPIYYAAIRSNVDNVRPTPLSFYRLTWNAEELFFEK
ncbi:MAG TPA: ABC transporter substrate-binding protein [Verrucomicrobiae bacterium]|nr:ABC transporter substrate-binding protein [Verrucomicrobiae bacterium]